MTLMRWVSDVMRDRKQEIRDLFLHIKERFLPHEIIVLPRKRVDNH